MPPVARSRKPRPDAYRFPNYKQITQPVHMTTRILFLLAAFGNQFDTQIVNEYIKLSEKFFEEKARLATLQGREREGLACKVQEMACEKANKVKVFRRIIDRLQKRKVAAAKRAARKRPSAVSD